MLVVFLIAFLWARDHTRERQTVDSFPPDDVATARLKILPYRQSGLIFSWGIAEPTILVDAVLWDSLPRDTQQDLGQAMAIAKNVRVVRLCDSKTHVLVASCTAAGRCRDAGSEENEPASTPRAEPPSRD